MTISNRLQEMNELRAKVQALEIQSRRIETSLVATLSMKILPPLIAAGVPPEEASRRAIEAAAVHIKAELEYDPGLEKIFQGGEDLCGTMDIMRAVFLEHHENCGEECEMTQFVGEVRESVGKLRDILALLEAAHVEKV
jgi:hypothetical protein